MAHRTILLVVFVGVFAAGCSKSDDVVRRPGEPDYVRAVDEALMERAIQKAKDTHGEFIQAMRGKRPGTDGFAIKKSFGGEHIWLSDVSWDGKVFSAVVDNEPVDTKEVKLGDRVQVAPDELSDWMYVEGGSLKGGYTIRVLHYQASPVEQEEMLKQVPFSIPAVDF